ncbi:hypothetical protein H0X91_15755 [Burkholderia sp. 9777_1386]|uniref:hypothetical protein n=1 Tax=Burkholderia sp. 9777_1386 TaxID=2751183 RepID=UPI0018C44036|nr:hypothetical protein [Burkholderia sp. 9777_1386]MBG0871427.1 hypothetical protein [Burkholderia sp. 9777_1386]
MTTDKSADALTVLRQLSKWAAGLSAWRDEPQGPYLRDIIDDARHTIAVATPVFRAKHLGLHTRRSGKLLLQLELDAVESAPEYLVTPVNPGVIRPPAASQPKHCQCPACRADVIHASDCAVHNAPALPRGPCDCGAGLPDSEGGEM